MDAKQQREKKWVAATSVVAAVFLTGMKLAIGLLTGSLGILAEAAHSGLDLVAAVITLLAVRVSDLPADESHLYGHGKVENLSALSETLLLLLTCAWIIYEAIHRLFFVAVEVDPSVWAFVTMGISIVIDFSRSRALARVAKKYNSQALEADALHFSTDIWSSAVVISGLALVWWGELRGGKDFWVQADAISALIVALIVICVSYQLGRRTVDALLDRAPQGLAERLSEAVSGVAGVQRVTRTRVRNAGNQVFVDLNVEVPRHLSFEESHAITCGAQDAVNRISRGADVVVHTVPVSDNEGLLERIQTVAARGHLPVHNITTHWTNRGVWIDLDLEVDPDLSFERAHILSTSFAGELKKELKSPESAIPVASIIVHIEPRAEVLLEGADVPSEQSARYVQTIQTAGRGLPHALGCDEIELHYVRNRLYLSLQLLIERDRSIAEVHEIAEEMEGRLRREIPELGRVVIHTEPA
jgi:cation diffusion facilitator family transporter